MGTHTGENLKNLTNVVNLKRGFLRTRPKNFHMKTETGIQRLKVWDIHLSKLDMVENPVKFIARKGFLSSKKKV